MVISKNEALKVMEKPGNQGRRVPFEIAFVTADRPAWIRRKRMLRELALLKKETNDYDSLLQRIDNIDTGGRIIEHNNCVLSGKRGLHSKHDKEQKKNHIQMQRNPHHWKNRTRNIFFLPSEQTRKCHIALITMFNGKEVVY